jgi:hypothetical protein
MKIQVIHTVIYDTNEQGFVREFTQSVDDYPATLSALEVFIKDRFIDPNFDKGTTTMEIVGE